MNLFSFHRKVHPMKKAYSYLCHLNKTVLQVLTVAFGQTDEIAVRFA